MFNFFFFRFGSEECRDFPMEVDNVNKTVCINKESNFEDAITTSVSKPIVTSVVESLDEYSNYTSNSFLKINDGCYENLNSFENFSDSVTKQCNFDEHVIKEEKCNSNELLISNDKLVETMLVSVDPKDIFIQFSPLKSPRVIDDDIFLNHTQNKLCGNHETRSNDVRSCNMDQIHQHQSIDENNIVLKNSTPEVEYEEENDSISSVTSLDGKIECDSDSDLEITRYGRLKCRRKDVIKNSNEKEYNEVKSDDKGVGLKLSNIVTTAKDQQICVDLSENKSDEEMDENIFEYKLVQSNNVNLCEHKINLIQNTNSSSEHHDVKCVDYSIRAKVNDLELNKKKSLQKKSATNIYNANTINLIKYKSQKKKITDYFDIKTFEESDTPKIEDKGHNLEQSDVLYKINETVFDDDLFSIKNSYKGEKLIGLETVNAIFTNNDEEKYSELQNKNLVVLDSEILDLSCKKSSVDSKIKITNCIEQKYQKKHIFKCTGEDMKDKTDDRKYSLKKTEISNKQNNDNDKTYFDDSMYSGKNEEKYSERPNADLAVLDSDIEDLSITTSSLDNKINSANHVKNKNIKSKLSYNTDGEVSRKYDNYGNKLEKKIEKNVAKSNEEVSLLQLSFNSNKEMEKTDDVNISTILDDLSSIKKDADKKKSELLNEDLASLYSEIEELSCIRTSVDGYLDTTSKMEKTDNVNITTIPDGLSSIKKGEDNQMYSELQYDEDLASLFPEIGELPSLKTSVERKLCTTICMKDNIVCTNKEKPKEDDIENFEDEKNNIKQSNSFHQQNNMEQDAVSFNKNENNFDKEIYEFHRLDDLQKLRFSSGEDLKKVGTSKIKKIDGDNKITDFDGIFGKEGNSNEEKKEYIEHPNKCLAVLNSENEGLLYTNLENNNEESGNYKKKENEEQIILKPPDAFLGEIEESNIKEQRDKLNDGDQNISLKQYIEKFSDYDYGDLEQNDVKFDDRVDNNFKNPNESFRKCSENLNHCITSNQNLGKTSILEKEINDGIEFSFNERIKSNKSVNITPSTFDLKENISLNNNDNKGDHIKREDENVETCIVNDGDINVYVQNDSITNENDNSFDLYSVSILDFKDIAMIETESSRPETSEVDQSSSLLFNESNLSEEEVENKKFIDQMYISLTKCKTIEYKPSLDTPSIELETKFTFPDNNEEIVEVNNRKSEDAKLVDVIHNIFEQESATESILTSNLSIHQNSKPNSLQLKFNLSNTTLYDNELVWSNSSHLLNNDDFGTSGINYCKSLNELEIIKNIESPKNVIVEEQSKNIPNEDLQPQKEENTQPTMLSASNKTRSLCGQHTENQNLDITPCTNTICQDDLQFNVISTDQSSVLLNKDCLPHSNQSLKNSKVPQKQLKVVLSPLSDTVIYKSCNIGANAIHQNILVQNPANLKNNIENTCTDIPEIKNNNLRVSSRKRKIIKPKCELSCCVAPQKSKRLLKKSSNIIDEVKQSKSDSCTNKNMIQNSSYQEKRLKEKSVTPSDSQIKSLKTSSKSKNIKTNLVQLDLKSSNLLKSPEIVEDNNGKVSVPGKRSKSKKNTGSKKCKSDPLKSLDPLVKAKITAKNSLELISEKEEDFKMEHNHPSTFLPHNTEENSPKRPNPVQANPLVTFSVVKTKLKKNISHKLSPLVIKKHPTSQSSSIKKLSEKHDSAPQTSKNCVNNVQVIIKNINLLIKIL